MGSCKKAFLQCPCWKSSSITKCSFKLFLVKKKSFRITNKIITLHILPMNMVPKPIQYMPMEVWFAFRHPVVVRPYCSYHYLLALIHTQDCNTIVTFFLSFFFLLSFFPSFLHTQPCLRIGLLFVFSFLIWATMSLWVIYLTQFPPRRPVECIRALWFPFKCCDVTVTDRTVLWCWWGSREVAWLQSRWGLAWLADSSLNECLIPPPWLGVTANGFSLCWNFNDGKR